MEWIDLGNPSPRAKALSYEPIEWPSSGTLALEPASSLNSGNTAFEELASQRRSRRSFAPLSLELLGALTWLSCRTLKSGFRFSSIELSLRPSPSAGAIHPIHVLIVQANLDGWHRYDPIAHSLRQVQTLLDPRSVMADMQQVLAAPEATLLLFAAEPGLTAAKYEAACSLVWRDAGALLGTMAMAAEFLGLSFCPLGVTGEPWISRLLDQPGLTGVGAAFVGGTPR